MNIEDAYYYKILLSCGISEGYGDWLDSYLLNEDPLSDIISNLYFCGSDNDKIIRCLHNHCLSFGFDEKIVCEKLRIFLKEAYYTDKMSKEEVVSYMNLFAEIVEEAGELDLEIWGDMLYMEYYYSLVLDNLIPKEKFDLVFREYLDNGTKIVGYSTFFSTKPDKESFFLRILKFFDIHK